MASSRSSCSRSSRAAGELISVIENGRREASRSEAAPLPYRYGNGSIPWSIALYGIVRCPGRGHDIVKSHDIVGAPTISCRHDIVSPPTIFLREYDIVLRSRYRVCVRYRSRGAISSPACDIVGPRGNIVRFPTISRVGPGIVPTRVIVSATRDIAGWDRISPRAPAISCVCAISFAGRDIVRPRAISQVRVAISYAFP